MTASSSQSLLTYITELVNLSFGVESLAKTYKLVSEDLQLAEEVQFTYLLEQEKLSLQTAGYTSELGQQAEAVEKLRLDYNSLSAAAKASDLVPTPNVGVAADTDELVSDAGRARSAWQELRTTLDQQIGSPLTAVSQDLTRTSADADAAKLAWDGLKTTIGERVTPGFTPVYEGFSRIVNDIDTVDARWTELKATIGAEINAKLEPVLKGLAKVVGEVGEIAKGIDEVVNLAKNALELKNQIHSKSGDDDEGDDEGDDDDDGGDAGGLGEDLEEGGDAIEKAAVEAAKSGVVEEGLEILEDFDAFRQPAKTGRSGHATMVDAVNRTVESERALDELKSGTPHSVRNAASRERTGSDERSGGARASIASASDPDSRTPVVLNIDGRKVAEAFVRNPNSQRYLAEAVEKGALTSARRRV